MINIDIHTTSSDTIKVGITYDMVIVGAGPSGLTLATLASANGYKVLVVETEKSVGGCHRVRRVNGLFSEHGPRVYTNSSKTFMKVLKSMNMDFYNYFTPYKFNKDIEDILRKQLSFKELKSFVTAFLHLVYNVSYGIDISLSTWLKNKEFSYPSIQLLDRVCKLTDGGGIEKYSLNKFLQIINTQVFYKMFQPTEPNDLHLLKDWKEYLDKKGVYFLMETRVVDISVNKLNKNIEYIIGQDTSNSDLIQIKGLDYIFACPPMQLKKVLDNISEVSLDKTLFFGPTFDDFAVETNYNVYLSMTFHWKTPQESNGKYGFTNGETYYDLVFIILSDYNKTPGTLVSLAVSNTTTKSPRNNKTALECTEEELITEVFKQLQDYSGFKNQFDSVVVSPGNGIDTAFIKGVLHKSLPFKSPVFTNLYTLGTHNDKSKVSFTSIETAVENAVVLFNEKYTQNPIKLGFRYTIVHAIMAVTISIFLVLLKFLL
jgi:hypothetical protein